MLVYKNHAAYHSEYMGTRVYIILALDNEDVSLVQADTRMRMAARKYTAPGTGSTLEPGTQSQTKNLLYDRIATVLHALLAKQNCGENAVCRTGRTIELHIRRNPSNLGEAAI